MMVSAVYVHPAQAGLRIAFGARWKELAKPAASGALEQLYSLARKHAPVTLLYGAKDEAHNNAVVLKELLEGMRKPPTSSGPAREMAARGRGRMPRR
jgi:hypothetical protein